MVLFMSFHSPFRQACRIYGRKADHEGDLTQRTQRGIVDVIADADDGTTQHIVFRLGALGLGLAVDAIADKFHQVLDRLTWRTINFICSKAGELIN